jgi:predicted permease
MSSWTRDVRFALRSLAKSPLFSLVVVASLALGIGANTAIFTIFDQVLLRLLPVKDPKSLVMVATRGPHAGSNRGTNVVSYPMYKDYRDQNTVFSGVLCRRGETVTLGYEGSTERVEAELVSGNYFEVLGVRAAAGRTLTRDDEANPGANPVVVLNHDYWRIRFQGDASIIGKTIRINNFPMTVVGVAASGFDGVSLGYTPKLHIPVTMQKQVTPSSYDFENRRSRWAQVFGRLKPGVSREQAEASMRVLYKQIIQKEAQDPWFSRVTEYVRQQFLRSYAVVLPGGQGYSGMRRALEQPMKVLMALVGLVLLIACANVSNLMLARGTNRHREISIRMALGAGRGRIMQQLLVESVLLALFGGTLGLVVSYWTTRAIRLLAPDEQARMAISADIDGRILLFNVLISGMAALLVGLLPSLRVSRTDLASALKEQSGTVAGGRGGGLRRALVVAQVALAFLLLMGSGLFVQSLQKLRAVDAGFRASNLIRFKLDPTLSGYNAEQTKQFYHQLQRRFESLPGVDAVGLAVVPIMEGDEWDSTVTVEGYQAKDGENMNPHFNAVSPDYFRTLGIPLVAGRELREDDVGEARKVALVNQTFAKRYFGERSPLGYHFGFGAGPKVKLDVEIVGVVRDAKYENLRQETPRQVFLAYQQNSWAEGMVVYVRTSLPSGQMFAAVRREVKGLDSSIPLFDLNTMEDQLERSLAIERMVAFLSGAFGALATALAVMGLYGVTAYSVARRSREIGIRIALGAEAGGVVRMVLREVLVLAAIGIGIGLPATWWLTQYVRSQLYGVEPRDPVAFAFSILGLLGVAVLAGAFPALKASRVDPVQILRYE